MPQDFLDGYDHYPDITTQGIGLGSVWVGASDTVGSFQAGRFAPGKCIAAGGGNSGTMERVVTPSNLCTIGFALRADLTATLGGGSAILSLLDPNGVNQISIGFDTVGVLRVGADSANPLAIGTVPLINNTWHFLELEFVVDDTNGRFLLRKDGAFSCQGENLVTQRGTPNVGRVQLRQSNGANSPRMRNWLVDDMYYLYGEAAARGESRVFTHVPIENSTVTWIPSAGTNWECVDDVPPDSDGTYNSSNTLGAQDLFGMTQVEVNPTQIYGVQVLTAARKDDAGTRTLQNLLKVNGSLQAAGTRNLVTDYTWGPSQHPRNPDGNVAWTKSAINSMKVGYGLIL